MKKRTQAQVARHRESMTYRADAKVLKADAENVSICFPPEVLAALEQARHRRSRVTRKGARIPMSRSKLVIQYVLRGLKDEARTR